MKTKIILLIIIAILSIVCYTFVTAFYVEKQNVKRLLRNIESSHQDLEIYKTQNGQLAYTNEVLVYKVQELKKAVPKVIQELENLKVKPKHAKQYVETSVVYDTIITTQIRDSIIQDTVHIRTFNYSDLWVQIQGKAQGNTQEIALQITDTIIQVVYAGKRLKPWLWFFSPRQLEQVITSKNPNSTIIYNTTIEILKR